MATERLKLHAVMVEDTENGGYSGYFKEFPQALAEGETKPELLSNMFKALDVLATMNKENEIIKSAHIADEQEIELAFAS